MAPNSPEIQELLDQAARGEAAAMDRLLSQQREPLRRMIGLRLDPALAARLDASDVVQDVLLEASQRLKEYVSSPSIPFHLWLRCLARDHVIDAHRRHRLAQRRSLDRELPVGRPDGSSPELAAQLRDPELTPASAALQQEMNERVAVALGSMPEEDREIILMKHFEQMPNQEIAQCLGLSQPAAAMRYLRALRRLRASLQANS
jgi:RNA polymerase sigma-70 factor (ECF subfamily)